MAELVRAILPVRRVYQNKEECRVEREMWSYEIAWEGDPLLLEREHPVWGPWSGLTVADFWSEDRKSVTMVPMVIHDAWAVDLAKFGWTEIKEPTNG